MGFFVFSSPCPDTRCGDASLTVLWTSSLVNMLVAYFADLLVLRMSNDTMTCTTAATLRCSCSYLPLLIVPDCVCVFFYDRDPGLTRIRMKVRRGVQERVVVDRQAEVVHETTSISSWVFGLHQSVCYDVPGALRPVDVLQTLCSWYLY